MIELYLEKRGLSTYTFQGKHIDSDTITELTKIRCYDSPKKMTNS